MSTRPIGVVTGKALKLTTATDVVTARDSLEWYDQKQIAVARGDAVAIRNGKTIRADVLTAYMIKTHSRRPAQARRQAGKGLPADRRPAKPRPHRRAAAPVVHRRSRREFEDQPGRRPGPCRRHQRRPISVAAITGSIMPIPGSCTLIGNVVITRGKDVIRGQYGVMDLNNNVSRMMPRRPRCRRAGRSGSQGLFVRQDPASPGAGAEGSAPRRRRGPAATGKKP